VPADAAARAASAEATADSVFLALVRAALQSDVLLKRREAVKAVGDFGEAARTAAGVRARGGIRKRAGRDGARDT
jgi:hypothetical protein